VVLNPETSRQLLPQDQKQTSLIEFLQRLDLSRVDTEREEDTGREIIL
jgi:hypothetical protein